MIPDIPVSFAAPGEKRVDATWISLYLFQIGDDSRRRSDGSGRGVTLRYLVTAWNGDSAGQAGEALLTLLFAARERPALPLDLAGERDGHRYVEIDVDLQPLSPSTWRGFGVPERPSFIIEVHVTPEVGLGESRHMVREPLRVQLLGIGAIAGRVVAAREVGTAELATADAGAGQPIAGAYVELPALGRITRTDAGGHFRFDGVPRSGRAVTVRVHARQSVQDFSVEPGAGELAIIRFVVKES